MRLQAHRITARPSRARLALATASAVLCSLAAWTPGASAAAPGVNPPSASQITTESARLETIISPKGKTTSWHFEYGLADCAANPCTLTPVPDSKIGGALESFKVGADLGGLTPGTAYHFRVVAKNSDGEVKTLDRIFRTASIPPPPEQLFGPCPNDAFRIEKPSAKLPDCRAYEQASPVDKNGLDATGMVSWIKASLDGDRVSFLTTNGLPGGEGAQEMPAYLSSRGLSEWSTQGLLPPASLGGQAFVIGWSPDFSRSYAYATDIGPALEGTLLERDSADGSLTTLVPLGAGLIGRPIFIGTSAGGAEVFFESKSKLLPDAVAGKPNVYLWQRATGQLRLAAALNDGKTPSKGAFAGAYQWIQGKTPIALSGSNAAQYTQDLHAVSSDGSLYFTEAGSGQLYLRKNPAAEQSALDGEGNCSEAAKACTIRISTSQRPEPDPLGQRAAAFMAATPDGSAAFFTSPEELTEDANTHEEAGPPPPHLIGTATTAGTERKDDLVPASAAAVDVDATHIYWADPDAGAIGRSLLDGTEPEPEFITGANNPQGVVVDATHVYWTNAADGTDGAGSIGRATLDGEGNLVSGSVKQDFITGASDPRGIDADETYVYWANHKSTDPKVVASIGRAELAGTDVDQFFIELETSRVPVGIAVDATHIYVTRTNEANNAFLYRFPIDGGDGKDHHEGAPSIGPDANEVAVDDEYIYWVDNAANRLSRLAIANYGGFGVETLISGIDSPEGLAVDEEHLYWSSRPSQLVPPGNDLYRYRFDAETGDLSDLTPDPGDENGAEVQGVLGTSADGSHVYFVANGDLDGAGPASAGDCELEGTDLEVPEYSGQCSLYLAHGGTVQFIARLDTDEPGGGQQVIGDALNWLPYGLGLSDAAGKVARVSSDGLTVLFRSQAQLTSYDNAGVPMLYRYRVGESGPTCLTCNPTGILPSGTASVGVGLTFLEPNTPAAVLSRVLSADGNRVFFESTDPLVSGDINGAEGCPGIGAEGKTFVPACQDVYEWEAKGTGSCEKDVQGGGCLYLLSTGKSTQPSYLVDASAEGEDAFIITRSRLLGQDEDDLYDVYDARVGGGLSAQNEVPAVPCEAEACRAGAAAPPQLPSPGTPSFQGPGDPKPKHAGKHKRHKARKKPKHRGKGAHHRRQPRVTTSAGRSR